MRGRHLLLAALLPAAAACDRLPGREAARPAAAETQAVAPGQADAQYLGQHIFRVADVVSNYMGSHRGRPPASLRAAGVDSLEGAVVRRIVVERTEVTIVAAYRRPDGRALHACRGTPRVLEDAALHGDEFAIECEGPQGYRSYTVRRLPAR